MRFLKFVEPNYRCKAVGRDGNTYEPWFCFAASEQEVRDLLKARGFKPDASVIESYSFSDWKDRANAEAKKANKAKNKDYEYKQKLWSEIKQYLFSLTNNRCGYCETKVRIGSPGDVEHYRPKRKPTEDDKHSGYYWLAYDIENYVPCCTNCNSARGKRNHFPLAPGSPRAKRPSEVADEKPLLLNPFIHNPNDHIRFIGPDNPMQFGELEGITPEGKESIEKYNLNRADLINERVTAFNRTKERLDFAKIRPKVRQGIISSYKSGELDYYVMVKPVFASWYREMELIEKAKIEKSRLYLKALENEKNMIEIE